MSQAFDHFIGTKPVSNPQAVDWAALEAYLQANLPGFAGPLSVEQFKGGQSNPTFKLITPARSYVMRAKPGPVAKLLPSAHAIEREFRVMKALAGTEVPVARMHVLCEDESVIGRAFYVMDFVDGRVLWDQSLPGMTRAQRGAIYDEMNRVIAALHSVDYAALGLADYGKPGNYFARQVARWSKQYHASVTGPNPAMDALIDWLPQHIPPGDDTAIVHGDYRLDNLIFHPSEPRILAVLDWELSTLGHPLADFSYHCMAWHIPPVRSAASAGSTTRRWAYRARATTSRATSSAPAARSRATGTSSSPTTCFAWRPSCRALPSGSKTAPPPARRHARPVQAPSRWPNSAGSSRSARGPDAAHA